jgi:glycosyltransferase involved in cell wall biosynthesis
VKIDVTPLLLTFNERDNIARSIAALSWAKAVLIIDSGSTDGTLELARSAHPNVRVVYRAFDNHTAQWNFGLDQVATPWVLSLDADYVLTPEFIAELSHLQPLEDVAGYSAEFRYCIFGHPLRASVYPRRTVLFRRARSRYFDDGHTQLIRVEGSVLPMTSKINHDDRKPFSSWIQSQDRYATIEARHLLSTSVGQLSFQDRLRRKIFFASPAMFFYLLFARALILDGWRGWFYVCQRTITELLVSIRLLIEKKNLEPQKTGA